MNIISSRKGGKVLRMQVNRKFIEDTIHLFSSHYNKGVGEEDAKEIISNVSKYFRILRDWNYSENSPSDETLKAEDEHLLK